MPSHVITFMSFHGYGWDINRKVFYKKGASSMFDGLFKGGGEWPFQ